MKRLYETINDSTFFTVYGIFTAIYNSLSTSPEWFTEDVAKMLDSEYYYNNSNEKWISPLFEKLISIDDETALSKIAPIVWNKFGDKWIKLYDAFIGSEYNPIENYSMVENSNTNTDIETERNVYGFNSDTAVPSENANTSGNKLTNTNELTRRGNIGVTTSQQMLESEIKLREWNLYTQMMKDVDSILCLRLY